MRYGMVLGAGLNTLGATLMVVLGVIAVLAAGSSSATVDELGTDLLVPVVLFAAVDGLAAAVGFWAYRALERARREARAVLTGMLGVNVLVALIAALAGNLGLAVVTALHLALGAGWLSLLCLPESSRRFFGDRPRATASSSTPATVTAPPAGPATGPAQTPATGPAQTPATSPTSHPHAHQPQPCGPAGPGARPAPSGRLSAIKKFPSGRGSAIT